MRKKPGEFSTEGGVEIEWVTKSEMKRESERLDKLGLQLLDLTEIQLAKIPLSEQLVADIRLAKKIRNTREGFRRQMQLIGKRLRYDDSDPIYEAFQMIDNDHLRVTRNLKSVEQFRDDVITKGDATINELIEKYPEIDRQKLRQLSRQANKEKKLNKPPKASGELFKYLREEMNEV